MCDYSKLRHSALGQGHTLVSVLTVEQPTSMEELKREEWFRMEERLVASCHLPFSIPPFSVSPSRLGALGKCLSLRWACSYRPCQTDQKASV